jgi:hypothetical protein
MFASIFVFSLPILAQKTVYIPSSFEDPNNTSSRWSYERSKESENWIVFWESGFGSDPSDDSDASLRVDVDYLLEVAEKSFKMNCDSLKFVIKGSSKTDNYKMIVLLQYSKDWTANGAGEDETVGLFTVSAPAAKEGVVIAHEIGHCFQYLAGADQHPLASGSPIVGWRYGLGTNGEGGNGWWEQCAQWQAFKVYPDQQFNGISSFASSAHLHILHEDPRYEKYYIQDFWTFLHGWDFIGRLWRESYFPEDPVDAYKRITGIDQEQFNNEMYMRAARMTTWDIPHIKENGKNHIVSWETNLLTSTGDGAWIIGADKCIQNYGFNITRLNAPVSASQVKVNFEGKAGVEGYRSVNVQEAGWRYGFVALLKNGERVYSTMGSSNYNKEYNSNPLHTLSFDVPDNCDKLWFVVSGSPQEHWHHEWDDDESNDEQWPYQVKFENTNIFGNFDFEPGETAYSDTLSQIVSLSPVTSNEYPSTPVQPDLEKICSAFNLSVAEIKEAMGSSIKYCAVDPDGSFNYESTAIAPGHWFDNNGYSVSYSNNNSHIFSEFRIGNFVFNIGQYPNRCEEGDQFTIKQALVYTPQGEDPVHVLFMFNIKIQSGRDIDSDNFTDDSDNCPEIYNEGQTDSDKDGVGDACDQCIGHADSVDLDKDGIPDGCDLCEGFNDSIDSDDDGMPDGCDLCEGSNDSIDSDNDGMPDGCDLCEGSNDSIDTNKDGIPDGCERLIVGTTPSSFAEVSLSPNPLEDYLNIDWTGANFQSLSIRIYDINGRLLWHKESIINQSAHINFKNWDKGMYFIHIFNNYERSIHKILKK